VRQFFHGDFAARRSAGRPAHQLSECLQSCRCVIEATR
jgi:hypothetical protein